MFVLPEVENVAVIQIAQSNAIVRIEDLQNGIVIALIVRIGLERGERLVGAFLRPGDGLRAVNVGEPEIGIRIGGSRGMFRFVLLHAVRSQRCPTAGDRACEHDTQNQPAELHCEELRFCFLRGLLFGNLTGFVNPLAPRRSSAYIAPK